MSRRCRWILGIGCWCLSLLFVPESVDSIGSSVPSTVYAGLGKSTVDPSRDASYADLRIAGKPRVTRDVTTGRDDD